VKGDSSFFNEVRGVTNGHTLKG